MPTAGQPDLFDHIETNNLTEFKKALLNIKKVNARNSRGETPLHFAVRENKSFFIAELLKHPGIDLEAKTTPVPIDNNMDDDEMEVEFTPALSALQLASEGKSREVIKMLVFAGARMPNITNVHTTYCQGSVVPSLFADATVMLESKCPTLEELISCFIKYIHADIWRNFNVEKFIQAFKEKFAALSNDTEVDVRETEKLIAKHLATTLPEREPEILEHFKDIDGIKLDVEKITKLSTLIRQRNESTRILTLMIETVPGTRERITAQDPDAFGGKDYDPFAALKR